MTPTAQHPLPRDPPPAHSTVMSLSDVREVASAAARATRDLVGVYRASDVGPAHAAALMLAPDMGRRPSLGLGPGIGTAVDGAARDGIVAMSFADVIA